jgi:hypothetical protein
LRPPSITFAVAQHEDAQAAWARASTAVDVALARGLSRSAAALYAIDQAWLEELDAACIDAEAEHAFDLHAQAVAALRAEHRASAPRAVAF